MATLGNVNIDGLDLSSAMRNDLAGGMSVSDFNNKYSSSVAGFRPIAASRQVGGGSAPAPAPAPAAVAAPAPNPWDSQVSALFGELGTNQVQNPVDVYNAALASLGLADARTRVSGLREQLMNSESLLKALPGDIQARTMDFNVSDNQRRKLLASESEPLAGQIDSFSRALDVARGDYADILGEGKTQADMTFQYESSQRQALMDRLQTAISLSKNEEDKRQWQAEFDRLKAQDEEAKRQFNANLALEQQKAAQSARSSSSSSSSTASQQRSAQQEVSNYILTSGQRGKDGYLSPVTYKQLKGEWVAAGWPSKDFDANFSMYANPTHIKDYGL